MRTLQQMSLHKMKNIILTLFISLFSLSSIPSPVFGSVTKPINVSQRNTYIVHVLPPEDAVLSNPFDLRKWHQSFMPDANTASVAGSQFLYSYSHAYSGFAARLTEEELKAMEKKPGFVSATPDRMYSLLTTHTPDFLGLTLSKGIWNRSNLGKGIIIGILDTGINPEHVSFHDDGVPAPPSRWKGSCNFGKNLCNNKLIGSKAFEEGNVAGLATDEIGHGTSTASIAAGNFVKGAGYNDLGKGTAAGVAPLAHLAIYKVCSRDSCLTVDVLAGVDAALKDGVDIISMSLGGSYESYTTDLIAVAAYRAVEKGIVVSAAAGNDGPRPGVISNGAPWILTVAASTTDRRFKATLRLGNGDEFDGESLHQPSNFTSKTLPLVLIHDVVNYTNKLVLCEEQGSDPLPISSVVLKGGGDGLIFFNNQETGYTTMVHDDVLPDSLVSYDAGVKIMSYRNSTEKPTASLIFKGTTFGSVAPEITFFSSRGPNPLSYGILKPDITGPGVNILAAGLFPPGKGFHAAQKQSIFNVIHGTSMSTPHLSGVTALVKCVHPDWSPAAIKSAILTTSYDKGSDKMPIKDEQHQEASVFAVGNGHVDPSKAIDPGLVYDIEPNDYIGFLCGLNYSNANVTAIVGRRVNCSEVKVLTEAELNYPTILVSLNSNSSRITRTVTNVGNAISTYKVEVEVPVGVSLVVKPETLQFSKVSEKKSFNVTVIKTSKSLKGNWKAQLKWVSDTHVVRSVVSEVMIL